MDKNLDVAPQSHKNQNHILSQMWQTTIVMLMFLFEISFIQRKIIFELFSRYLWYIGDIFVEKYPH